MPAFVTHALFGEKVARSLPAEIKLLVEAHPGPFYWGLQGPDLLFFRDAVFGRSELPEIGGVMHCEKTAQLLTNIAKYVRKRRTLSKDDVETVLSYFLGFLCHYTLDSVTHPYVYYLQERRKSYSHPKAWGGLHHQIESQIDTALYALIKDDFVANYSLPKEAKNAAEEAAIARLYRQVLWHTYGIEVKTLEVAKAFDDARFLMKLVLKGELLPAVRVAERNLLRKENSFSAHMRPLEISEDVLNENHGIWAPLYDPDHPKSSSFLELFEEAESLSHDSICLWYQGIKTGVLPSWEGCPSFDHGAPKNA